MNGGGGIPDIPEKPGSGGGKAPAPTCCNMGFACPASAYDDVMESMTDCAFSCPISDRIQQMHSHLLSKSL